MSSFSEANLVKKLADLNSSQQSIQTLSLWLIHHRKHATTVVNVWMKELMRAPVAKKLTFIYLANDVIQNAKKKGPEFTKAFITVLPLAFEHTASASDEKTVNSLNRLLQIWTERLVIDEATLARLRTALGGSGEPDTKKVRLSVPAQTKQAKHPEPSTTPPLRVPQPVAEAQQASTSSSPPADGTVALPPPEPEDLARLIMELERSASSDADVRQRIAALPPEISDISNVDKIRDLTEACRLSTIADEACKLLADYNGRLATEMADRQKLSAWLASSVTWHRDYLAKAEQNLQEYKSRLEKVKTVRQELKNHIQNLPDLTLLPDPLAGGLAPLPSAGDLFSV